MSTAKRLPSKACIQRRHLGDFTFLLRTGVEVSCSVYVNAEMIAEACVVKAHVSKAQQVKRLGGAILVEAKAP